MRNPLRRLVNGRRVVDADEPLDCPAVMSQLQLYLDSRIDQFTSAKITEHLSLCRMCGLEDEAYRQIQASLAQHRSVLQEDDLESLRQFAQRVSEDTKP